MMQELCLYQCKGKVLKGISYEEDLILVFDDNTFTVMTPYVDHDTASVNQSSLWSSGLDTRRRAIDLGILTRKEYQDHNNAEAARATAEAKKRRRDMYHELKQEFEE